MRLDLYFAETAHVAREQTAMLEEARQALEAGRQLSPLERNGVLHALQILIENSIGMAKHLLKNAGEPVPISGYDSFVALQRAGLVPAEDLETWNRFIGLRNRIVHEYMNIDFDLVLEVVRSGRFQFLNAFLQRKNAVPGKTQTRKKTKP
jgi:uncharacterized protein YutE (UPF0331/DUF86 family)